MKTTKKIDTKIRAQAQELRNLGLTLKEIADKLGISFSSVRRFKLSSAQVERGKYTISTLGGDQVESAKADSAQANSAQANSAQANSAQADSAQANSAQADSAQANSAQVESAQVESAQATDGFFPEWEDIGKDSPMPKHFSFFSQIDAEDKGVAPIQCGPGGKTDNDDEDKSHFHLYNVQGQTWKGKPLSECTEEELEEREWAVLGWSDEEILAGTAERDYFERLARTADKVDESKPSWFGKPDSELTDEEWKAKEMFGSL